MPSTWTSEDPVLEPILLYFSGVTELSAWPCFLSLYLPICNLGELEEMILKVQYFLGPQGSQWVLTEARCLEDLWAMSAGSPRSPSCPRCMNGELCLLLQGATMQHGPHWVGGCLQRVILRNSELEWDQPVSHMHMHEQHFSHSTQPSHANAALHTYS